MGALESQVLESTSTENLSINQDILQVRKMQVWKTQVWMYTWTEYSIVNLGAILVRRMGRMKKDRLGTTEERFVGYPSHRGEAWEGALPLLKK